MGWLVECRHVYTVWDADEKYIYPLVSSPLPVALFTAYFGACMTNLMAVVSLLCLSSAWLVSTLMPTQAAPGDRQGPWPWAPLLPHEWAVSHSYPLTSQETLVQTIITRLVTNVRLLSLKYNLNNSFINNSIPRYHTHGRTLVLRSWL